jgi:hypothetical protein
VLGTEWDSMSFTDHGIDYRPAGVAHAVDTESPQDDRGPILAYAICGPRSARNGGMTARSAQATRNVCGCVPWARHCATCRSARALWSADSRAGDRCRCTRLLPGLWLGVRGEFGAYTEQPHRAVLAVSGRACE